MRFVDSHLHLDGPGARVALDFAKSANILVVACGVDRDSSESLIRLMASLGDVMVPFVGVHPSEAGKQQGLAWVEEYCKLAGGIGEIGLDPTYSPVAEGTPQMDAFTAQLRIAEEQGKPVQVHSRNAEQACLEALSGTRISRVLMHWLESEQALPRAMDRGYYVSFGPALLYSKKLQKVAARADPSLTLLETDFPVAYGPLGGATGPVLIPSVAFKLAELAGRGFSDTLEDCNRNALRFIGGQKG